MQVVSPRKNSRSVAAFRMEKGRGMKVDEDE
jgi:hypothetical protein